VYSVFRWSSFAPEKSVVLTDERGCMIHLCGFRFVFFPHHWFGSPGSVGRGAAAPRVPWALVAPEGESPGEGRGRRGARGRRGEGPPGHAGARGEGALPEERGMGGGAPWVIRARGRDRCACALIEVL